MSRTKKAQYKPQIENQKKCRECRQAISRDATRCHHCTAYQNYFRFLGTAALLAGFALTLISILLAPPIKDLFEEKKADITISILEGDFNNITFMISNMGNRPAGLSQIEIDATLKYGEGAWYLYSDLDKKLIEPGKAYIVKASNGSAIPAAMSQEIQSVIQKNNMPAKNNQCKLVIQYVQMDGTKYYMSHPFFCYKVKS